MTLFHADDYVHFLSTVTPDTQHDYATQVAQCLSASAALAINVSALPLSLADVDVDCPVFDGLFKYCQIYTGGSVGTAFSSAYCIVPKPSASAGGAYKLNRQQADICINWAGGLHHAKKAEASGFCYVNDIVLAILELLKCVRNASEVEGFSR